MGYILSLNYLLYWVGCILFTENYILDVSLIFYDHLKSQTLLYEYICFSNNNDQWPTKWRRTLKKEK